MRWAVVRWVAYGLRFVCELAAVAAFVWLGWPAVGWVLGAIVAVVWGGFVAPRAVRRLRDPARFLTELVVFGGAAACFAEVGHAVLAVVFGATAVVTAVAVRVWPEPGP